MQLLTFNVAGQTYAIESRRVIEVLPLVPARPIPHMPNYIRGIFTYRGRLVPLVDLALLLAVGRLQERLSTRVIVVEYAAAGCESQRLG
ncbi:MAG: chemotaxis protein CheW, partial [Planctomycetota bacterium]